LQYDQAGRLLNDAELSVMNNLLRRGYRASVVSELALATVDGQISSQGLAATIKYLGVDMWPDCLAECARLIKDHPETQGPRYENMNFKPKRIDLIHGVLMPIAKEDKSFREPFLNLLGQLDPSVQERTRMMLDPHYAPAKKK
jgi:hypothetical protein